MLNKYLGPHITVGSCQYAYSGIQVGCILVYVLNLAREPISTEGVRRERLDLRLQFFSAKKSTANRSVDLPYAILANDNDVPRVSSIPLHSERLAPVQTIRTGNPTTVKHPPR